MYCQIDLIKEINLSCSIIDLHMHIVPSYDDGARNLNESLEMLKIAERQGVTDIFCTSHRGCTIEDTVDYLANFKLLKENALKEDIKVNLHKGCEILTSGDDVDSILYGIEKGMFPTLGQTKYVLIEFYPDTMPSEATKIVQKVVDKGYAPIIAHMERNYNLSEMMIGLLIKMGALIQVNAFSFAEEGNSILRNKARSLLSKKYIHFIGSDAHGINHRPPKISSGVEYIINNVEQEYATEILSGNANNLILKRG